MKMTCIKFVRVDLDNPLEGEEQISELISIGFQYLGDPLIHGDRIIISMTKPPEKEYIRFETAYPTTKQIGYICWAYRKSSDELDPLKIMKNEASKLIEYHKEKGGGNPFESAKLVVALDRIRGKIIPVPPAIAPDDEYDEEIPF